MAALKKQIIDHLCKAQPKKAREIGRELGVTRKEVNSELYKNKDNLFVVDDQYRWCLANGTTRGRENVEKKSGKRKMPGRYFGEIKGQPVGTTYKNRKALSEARVHRPLIAGISGSKVDGADSIVISGGYEDDSDRGDLITYTGHGGNDPNTGQQIADQELHRGNKGLSISCEQELPVRVVRGAKGDLSYSPGKGLRYDGLYLVEKFWSERGRSGFLVWRFQLRRRDPTPAPWEGELFERIKKRALQKKARGFIGEDDDGK